MYTISNYLLDRLNEIGVKHIFGVPGDFNLNFLDYVVRHDEIKWHGNTNELNAAYMADGYARVNGISALLTTYGVGELSAINGIAGSYAEDVPIIKIVGVPQKSLILGNKIIHHTLGDNNYDAFLKMYQNTSIFQVWLNDKDATMQIDEAIRQAVFYKKPVYIMFPTDIVNQEAIRPRNEINFKVSVNRKNLETALYELRNKVSKAEQAIIISGHKVIAYNTKELLEKFVENTNISICSSIFGKSSFNEEHENFIGMFLGKNTYDIDVKEFVKDADLIITVGVKFSDLASSNDNLLFDKSKMFEINEDHVKFDNQIYTQIPMGAFLSSCNSTFFEYEGYKLEVDKTIQPYFYEEKNITMNRFYEALNSFIRKDDIIVSDVGTCMFVAQNLQLKSENQFLMQPLWASIGFSFPAAAGAKLAMSEKRVINVIGDGAFSMSLNELASIIDKKVNYVIFLINNKGYTIEKLIHGPNEIYNEIPNIDYKTLLKAFDPENLKTKHFLVKTEKDLYTTLLEIENINDKLVLVELDVEKMDIPSQLENIF